MITYVYEEQTVYGLAHARTELFLILSISDDALIFLLMEFHKKIYSSKNQGLYRVDSCFMKNAPFCLFLWLWKNFIRKSSSAMRRSTSYVKLKTKQSCRHSKLYWPLQPMFRKTNNLGTEDFGCMPRFTLITMCLIIIIIFWKTTP